MGLCRTGPIVWASDIVAAPGHRIGVARFAAAKRASMRAHASQAADSRSGDRTLGMLVRIPRPLYDLVFGQEWFVDPLAPTGTARTDVFSHEASRRARVSAL